MLKNFKTLMKMVNLGPIVFIFLITYTIVTSRSFGTKIHGFFYVSLKISRQKRAKNFSSLVFYALYIFQFSLKRQKVPRFLYLFSRFKKLKSYKIRQESLLNYCIYCKFFTLSQPHNYSLYFSQSFYRFKSVS